MANVITTVVATLALSASVAFSCAQAHVLNLTVGRSAQENELSSQLPEFLFVHERKDRSVVFQKRDDSSRAFMQLLRPVPYLKNTRDYALYVMKELQGSALRPEVDRRGYSFVYKEDDIVPCSAVVAYFDGVSYLMYGACGKISQNEISKAFTMAKRTLVLDEMLYRTSLPTTY